MANYRGPFPVDPISYRLEFWLCIQCPCGRQEALLLRDVALRHRLPGDTRLYAVIRRLRCTVCGSRKAYADVRARPPWKPSGPGKGTCR